MKLLKLIILTHKLYQVNGIVIINQPRQLNGQMFGLKLGHLWMS